MVPGEKKERKMLQLNLNLCWIGLMIFSYDNNCSHVIMQAWPGSPPWCWPAHCFYFHPLCGDGGIRSLTSCR